jgi:outer membrane receptor protein involved in Fe transport
MIRGWVWFLAGALALAQAPRAELRLMVVDPSGAPLQPRVDRTHLPTGRRIVTTCAASPCVIALDTPGRYHVDLSQDGFGPASFTVDLKSGETVERRVRLSLGATAFAVEVVAATPLAGLDRTRDEIPAPTQAATARDVEASGALDLSDFLARRLSGVYLNEIQGNPYQADLNYRGYTASPLLGTPQGLSVYFDGVRLNQPFGDVVSWDLVPRAAIAEVALLPGSNPLFGLNTLGGALSLRTKDGRSHPGTAVQLGGGSFGRRTVDLEQGGSRGAWHWYGAGQLFFEDGWREASPSNVRQYFGTVGRAGVRTAWSLSLSDANNSLVGNGLQEQRLLARDWTSIYTKPDRTTHRAPFTNLQLRHTFHPQLTFSGNAYLRYLRTRTLNGDLNEGALDQNVYQPNTAERAALARAGFTGFPLSGENAANTPFPFWRCLANVLLRDEPGEKCNGLITRSATHQRNYGVSGQFMGWTRGRAPWTAGAAWDGNGAGFTQLAELGYLNPDRGITGVRAFADGVTGGDVDGEPFDTRVNLSGRIYTSSAFATATVPLRRAVLTFAGRFNHTLIDNVDRLRPRAGRGSLTGRHAFDRFNPAAGITVHGWRDTSWYASYAEGNRAPTSIELGCADPESPCRLPNAMAGDPPLRQVTTRTVEAGIRGGAESNVRWSGGYFFATNRDDILFVASEPTGFGYFKNFGRTQRQGAEFDLRARAGRFTLGGGYTLLAATFESPEEVNGTGNSSNRLAQRGARGLESSIAIRPGNRLPLTPSHVGKAFVDAQWTRRFLTTVHVFAASRALARGNENGLHQPDGTYYLGPGASPGYAVAGLAARYQIQRHVQLFVQVNNLFDRRFYTAAQLGATGFTAGGRFVARPLPAVNGQFPVAQSTFFAPGAPRGIWGGLLVRF